MVDAGDSVSVRRYQPEDFGFGRLFYRVSDTVVVADALSERIVLWGGHAEDLLGYTEEEALGLPLHCLVPEDVRELHRRGLARYQETGRGDLVGARHPTEVVALRKDGSSVTVELTLTAIPERGPNGERYALAIIRDVSDRKEAEQARIALERENVRQEQALELNDVIVQGLAVSKMALETGRTDIALDSVTGTLNRAKAIVADLLTGLSERRGIQPGDLVRRDAADFGGPKTEQGD